MAWISDTIASNGIYYTRTGGDKPPLLMLHGLTDNGLYWTTIAQDLEADYDVIMPDARGHGRSEPVSDDAAWNAAAEDAAAVIMALGLKQPGVIGHSMGAGTASILAATHPDLVGFLVLEDPPLFESTPSAADHFARDPWERSLIALKALPRRRQLAAARREHPNWPDIENERWVDSKEQFNLSTFHKMFGSTPNWRDFLTLIHCPTLLITGDNALGSIVTPAIAQEVTEKLPNCRVVHIPGAGHSIRFDQHDAYLKAVTAFLKDQSAN